MKKIRKYPPKLSRRSLLIATALLLTALTLGIMTVVRIQTKPRKIDFSSKRDFEAEKYYLSKIEEILSSESKKLGEPLALLGASQIKEPVKWCRFTNDPAHHDAMHGCEISQLGYINLDSPLAKQRFYEASKKLNALFDEQKWETTGSTEFDPNKSPGLKFLPFAAFLTTHELPFTYQGVPTSGPTTYYYKTRYYSEIDHQASCTMNMSLDPTQQSISILASIGCHFSFD